MSVFISITCISNFLENKFVRLYGNVRCFCNANHHGNRRLPFPVENFRAQKGEPIQIKTPNPFSYEMEDTWTPYVTRQSTMMSPIQRGGSKSPVVPFTPRRLKPSESPDLTLYPVSQGLLMSPSPRYGTGLGGSRGFLNYV